MGRVLRWALAILGVCLLGIYRGSSPPLQDLLVPAAAAWYWTIATLGGFSSIFTSRLLLAMTTGTLPIAAVFAWHELTGTRQPEWTIFGHLGIIAALLLTTLLSRPSLGPPALRGARALRVAAIAVAAATALLLTLVSTAVIREARIAQWLNRQTRAGAPALHGDSKVTVAVFEDYQCPVCRRQWQALKPMFNRLSTRYPGQIEVRMLDFPLEPECNPAVTVGLHAYACEEAVALRVAAPGAERARLMERFFDLQERMTADSVSMQVEDLGLLDAYRSQYQMALRGISSDVAVAQSLNVTGTPTYFVNGIRCVGWTPDFFESIIVKELER